MKSSETRHSVGAVVIMIAVVVACYYILHEAAFGLGFTGLAVFTLSAMVGFGITYYHDTDSEAHTVFRVVGFITVLLDATYFVGGSLMRAGVVALVVLSLAIVAMGVSFAMHARHQKNQIPKK